MQGLFKTPRLKFPQGFTDQCFQFALGENTYLSEDIYAFTKLNNLK